MVPQDANLNERSNSSFQDENIYEKLKKAAQDGDIERLYKLIAEDQDILCHFDKRSLFVRRHYTIADEKGQTDFAMELLTLKPSYAIKLSVSDFIWLCKTTTFKWWEGLWQFKSSLVSIKGRGRITPLYHVARAGDAELILELLLACPSSIEDLMIKCEIAVHISVKSHQLMVFKVLLGWLRRVSKEGILNWKDEDGNTGLILLHQ